MPSPAERPEGTRTLPRPELNPLLNPVLADNMGRWAEVYFTTPPEKREEAVLELLRELKAGRPEAADTASAPEPPAVAERTVVPAFEGAPEKSQPEQHKEDLRRCQTCGHENPVTHQFCGMCGAPVEGAAFDERGRNSAHEVQNARREHSTGTASTAPEIERRLSGEEESGSPAEEPRRDTYDLSLFQSFREKEGIEDFDYGEKPSTPYRYYFGALLAVVILLLGYIAWRNSKTIQDVQEAPPPPAVTESAPTSSNASATPAATSNPPKAAEVQPTSTAPASPAPASSSSAPAAPKEALAAKQPETPAPTKQTPAATGRSTPPDNSQTQGSQGNGAEELAMAQRYLNSQPRDSAEGARWLWKAMAKHNGPATLLLADLYLKGDGVSKNCDQARVLLDSAARRGMAGAGERLRNLQAFGCQ